MKKLVFTACALIAAIGLPITASAMGLSLAWGPTKKCFDPKSPPMTVSAAPTGTKKLRFNMTDLDAPDYPHGGGTVVYTGNGKLPYGAFRYRGPCPPSPHIYRMTVEALDGSGKVLAMAAAKRRFP